MRIIGKDGKSYRAEDLMKAIGDQSNSLKDFREKLRMGFPGWPEDWYMEREDEFIDELYMRAEESRVKEKLGC